MNNKLKQQVIEARLVEGLTFTKIKSKFGVAKSTAQGWIAKFLDGDSEGQTEMEVEGHLYEHIERAKPKLGSKELASIEEFIEQLAPLQFPAPKRKVLKSSPSNFALVAGDFHFPLQCDSTVDIFFQVVEEIQPKVIVLNGDTVDLLAVSKYPKDVRKTYSLQDERVAYHEFLHKLLSITSEDTVIYETSANHSGNGVEGRWWRYLSANVGDLASLPEMKEKLSYQEVFLGEYQNYVEYVDHVQLTEDFIILHGDVVRKNGGYSARGMFDKWFISLMHNHTHRFGMTAQRVPKLGNRENKQFYAWENGCMCDLDPVYATATNWQNGFSIIALDGQSFGVEPVMVNDGVATIASLGKTLYAE